MKGLLFYLGLTLGLAAVADKKDDNPVTRVVGLLKDLQSRIEKDGAGEQAAYDKYACWCEETSGKSAATISSLRDLLKTTGNTILRLKGSITTLSSEIQGLAEDIKKNEDQQAELTSVREKENVAFLAEKLEMEQAIAALEKAIAVLGDATSASFMQTSKWTSSLSEVISKLSKTSLVIKYNDRQFAALQELSGKRLGSSYAPQSATIQGMLSDMYHTFTNNLQTSTAEEAKAHRNYEDLISTYQEELAKLQETLVKKEAAKTEDEIQLADATQTFADSEDQLKAEISLFDITKESCAEKTEDWSKRSSLRKMELDGVKKALEVLTSDEAKELFAKSIKPGFSGGGASSFIQVASLTDTATGDQKALTVLEKRAEESQSFRLAALAADIRMQDHGHFDAVIKSIDDLLAQLDEEEKEDIAKVDSCKEEYKDLTSSKNDLDWKIENNKAKVQKHEKAISQKTEAKEVTIESIEDADKQLADMLKERKEGNDAYKKAKDDDEKAIALLRKANQALAKYYETALLQQPDLKLSDKDSASNQTQGVVSLIDMIITDLTQELAEGKAAEKAAQLAYEKMKQSIEDQKAKLEKKKINLEGQIAEEGTSKTAEEDLQKENEDDLDNTKKTEADLKKTCDDAIRLQPERRKKRKIEADGLNQAKEFLAGMSSDAFLQTPRHDAGRGAIPTFRTLSFLQRSRSL